MELLDTMVFNGKNWNIYIDRRAKKSYTDPSVNEIVVKDELDLVHEVIHVLLLGLPMGREENEFLTRYLENQVIKLFTENISLINKAKLFFGR